jgi:inner membrane protein
MIIGVLSLLLLIPAAMIRGLINEREERNAEAQIEISDGWSLSQTISGPFLSIPTAKRNTFHLMPEKLDISGNASPIEKKRGIFTSVVYTSQLKITGSFNLNNEQLKQVLAEYSKVEKAYLSIGLEDLRGIGNQTSFLLNGQSYEIEPGLYNNDLIDKGIHIPVSISKLKETGKLEFWIDLELKGSTDLFFTPVGKKTTVNLSSTWPDPSFTGKFLPDEKQIDTRGFSASWAVNYMNRNFPQQWFNNAHSLESSSFGVYFLLPVDHYQKSERSVKYAFMFIALSFLVFFLTEIILKIRIHPIQYLLVGFALIIFYSLLISFSEHLGFNTAYYISTAAVTLLIGFYMKSSTGSSKVGVISSLLLLALYGFLFTTIQLQELSLLMGSIGLFIILMVIMIVSRKVNWYRQDAEGQTGTDHLE